VVKIGCFLTHSFFLQDDSKKFQGDENVSPDALSSLFTQPIKLCSSSDSMTPGKGTGLCRWETRRESSAELDERSRKVTYNYMMVAHLLKVYGCLSFACIACVGL